MASVTSVFTRKLIATSLIACFSMFATLAHAQYYSYSGPTEPDVPNVNAIEAYESLGVPMQLEALDNNLMGDTIDVDTGQLTIRHTDVSLPGNSEIPVYFGRALTPSSPFTDVWNSSDRGALLGDWLVDVPHIKFRVVKGESGLDTRCSDPGDMYRLPVVISMGLSFRGPQGAGGQLHRSKNLYSGAAGAEYATNDGWRITCTATAIGVSGEGFIATSPNGIQYTLNKVIRYDAHEFRSSNSWTVNADNLIFWVTKAQDVNGNWVRYEYNRYGPTRIYSNDDREIRIAYDAEGKKITSVSANGRTWHYESSGRSLTKVTRPDGKQWQLQAGAYSGSRSLTGTGTGCTHVIPLNITHPNGVKALFRTKPIRNNFVNVPQQTLYTGSPPTIRSCRPYGYPYPLWHITRSVTQKMLTLPSGKELVWSFDYGAESDAIDGAGPDLIGWANFKAPPIKTRTIIDPEGHKTVVHLSREWWQGVGSVLKRERFESETSTTPIRVEEAEYEYGFGVGASMAPNDHTAGAAPLMTKRVITQQGETYTTEYTYQMDNSAPDFAFKNPSRIRSYSTLQAGERITDVVYEHKLGPWVINLPKKISHNGLATNEFVYDSRGRRIEAKEYGAWVASYAYHSTSDPGSNKYKGALYKVTDASYNTWQALDWKLGTPQTIQRPDNTTIERTVNNYGWVLSEKDALGRVDRYRYDIMGRVTHIDPHGNWANTQIAYDFPSEGGAIQTITRGGRTETITYDGLLRQIKTNINNQIYTQTEYDGLGRAVFSSFPSSSSNPSAGTRTTYDALGRMTQARETVFPYATTSYRYTGNSTIVTDPENNRTSTTYYGYGSPSTDEPRRILTYDSNAYWQSTTIKRDIWGKITSVSQDKSTLYGLGGEAVTQTYTYDARQRLCRHYTPETGATKYAYDNAGRVVAYAKGQSNSGCSVPWTDARVSMQYDTLGRLITTNFRDATTPDIHRTYDANGNIKTVQRGGVNWSYAYNDADLITSENLDIDGRHYDLSYHYDSLERMDSQYLPAAGGARQQLQYQYDSLDRATRVRAVKSGQASVTLAHSISYHPDGQVRRFTYGNGYVYNKTLNARLQPSRVWNEKGSAKAFDRSYAYDKRGLVTSIDDGVNDAYSLELGYGPLGRLWSASGIWGRGSFGYDSLGNLTSKRLGDRTVRMSYDSKNRLSSYTDTGPGGSKSLSYDARGNVTALGDLNFKYDYSDQPVQVSGQASGQYRYDGNLKRVKSVINGKSIYNIYNLAGQLVHVDEVSDNTRTDYVGGGGMSIARIQNNRITYLHNDHLGSTAAATDASGRLLWTQHHTPFGESWNQVAANDDQAGYTGHIKDSATGLMYMQARYYDPVIGRFLSNDPVGFLEQVQRGNSPAHGFNRYAYVNNNPYKYVDPDGEFLTLPLAAFGAVAGAVAGATSAALNGGGVKAVAASAFAGAVVGGVTGLTAGTVAAGSALSVSGIFAASATGALASASGEAIGQLASNGGDVSKVDGTKVGVAGIVGAASGQIGAITQAITGSAKAAIRMGAATEIILSPGVANAENSSDGAEATQEGQEQPVDYCPSTDRC